ncbi:hypothetical protein FIBSPDRAFT_901997 [Athelia psychrophila]|uniref:Uncharacterized protein n=1 Tax=Athelia psychrophila TaxID=1759441 RepID=A0A167XSI5_9AGAM|nr:hypothetical protein FIBSPDRAFT_901997 [Fibularhizoctonia sp. CBS 109695]
MSIITSSKPLITSSRVAYGIRSVHSWIRPFPSVADPRELDAARKTPGDFVCMGITMLVPRWRTFGEEGRRNARTVGHSTPVYPAAAGLPLLTGLPKMGNDVRNGPRDALVRRCYLGRPEMQARVGSRADVGSHDDAFHHLAPPEQAVKLHSAVPSVSIPFPSGRARVVDKVGWL